MRQVFRVFLLLLLATASSAGTATEPAAPRVLDPYAGLDRPVVVDLPGTADGDVGYTLHLLRPDGGKADRDGSAHVAGGRASVQPLGEGIHVLTFGDRPEVRFLAFAPPAKKLDLQYLASLLPQTADKLHNRRPLRILALGDSVTATGAYPQLFAQLLAAATDDHEIAVDVRAHSGRSIDATVRKWDEEVVPSKPDLALLMYGLNDQAASTGLDVYLQQIRWVHAKLKAMGCELVLLTPTPHIDLKAAETDPGYPIRTIGYAQALRPLAAELHVPLVDTFNALWDSQHRSLPDASKVMWVRYPRRYSLQFTAMLESDGVGDTIHPNALGHLAMARAIYDALLPSEAVSPLQLAGDSVLDSGTMYSTLQIRNTANSAWKGSIDLYPPIGTRLAGDLTLDLDLAAGSGRTVRVEWPDVKQPADLYEPPYLANAVLQPPAVHLIMTHEGRSQASAVFLPFRGSGQLRRGRQMVPASAKTAAIEVGALSNTQKTIDVPLPTDRGAATVPVSFGGQLAQAYLVRTAGALPGEATVDGRLEDWKAHLWRSVCLPLKSRTAISPAPAVRFAVKAGAERMFLAIDSNGDLQGDQLELFFDARTPEQFGTVGAYAWLDCDLQPDGKVKLSPGETSPKPAPAGLQATWQRQGENGSAVEIAIPYALFGATAWPKDGDLGMGLVWHHKHQVDGKTVAQRFLWSDDAHWWNPTGWGVVRLQQQPDDAALPWLVRVR